uniref:Uncharacterized protein n=1 Tax=Rhizophora mucronata TaxID=61149 RepID=A0A2P2MPH9_RHIMU
MADETASLIVSVDKRLNSMSSIARCDPYLFKVPSPLRRVNEKAYEPEMIAIGPYHRDRDYLQAMTEHKWWYLHQLLQRLNEDSAASYIEALSELEEKARLCYAEPITLDKDMFVQMLLLDGCFVVELIRKMTDRKLVGAHDPIFKFQMILDSVKRDLLLLENQLPFFILKTLFDMTLMPNQESNFIELIFKFFRVFPGSGYKREDQHSLQNIQHLLGLMHDNWLPSPKGMEAYKNTGERETQSSRCLILWPANCGRKRQNEKDDDTRSHMRCATELKEAGIKFKRAEGCSLFDIKFENGTLLIPKLTIEDRTESVLRNLIAYEQFSKVGDDPHHVINYTMLMDCLINTEKDVELLSRRRIIDNWLGDDAVIATLFNKLLDNVRLCNEKSYYADTYEQVNKHCSKRCNLWMAKLRHDYFYSPWALISFLAALLLLSLTLIQTLYSLLSYYKKSQ